MDGVLVKLLTHMEVLAGMDASDYEERLNTHVELLIRRTYSELRDIEKQWIDERIDVLKCSQWSDTKNISSTLRNIREEYVNTYTPKNPMGELFVWLDTLLRAGTHAHLTYDTEYLTWNILRCREYMTQKELEWIGHRFSIQNLMRSGVYSEEDVLGMYDAWETLSSEKGCVL